MPARETIVADTRYTFTGQYLEASAIFVRLARTMEATASRNTDDSTRCEHRGLICAVIMQCAAALETEAHEVCTYGPGSHLGSNGTDHEAQRFLSPIADVVDERDTMSRFELILHLLRKQPLNKGAEPFQSAALVVRLRNELLHYKSRWGADMASNKLYAALQSLQHSPPAFTDPSMNFFPHRCLSADCAAWALRSVVAFLEEFYHLLGVPSRLEKYRSRLVP
jgi:hypothetical protein